MLQPDDVERLYTDGIELRAATPESKGPGTLAGYAIKWNSMSEPLSKRGRPVFRETFRDGAFTRSLRTADVLAVVDHEEGASKVYGRTVSKTLRLAEDEVGLRFENVLPDTAAGRDLAHQVARGDIRGVSVAFVASKGGDSWVETRSEMPVRVVADADLFHLSYEARPAYRDTSVALRSLAAALAEPEEPAAPDSGPPAPSEPETETRNTPPATPEIPKPSLPLSLAKARLALAEAD